MSSPTLTPARQADAADDVGPDADPLSAAAETAQTRLDGVLWVHRLGSEQLLRSLPPEAWSDPAAQGWQRVKQNARREVWRAVIGGVSCYVKYFHHRASLSERLRSLFRRPSCLAEWNGGMFALRAGIAAVRPVGYTLDLPRGKRSCALLVTEAVEHAQPLSDFWKQLQADDDPLRRRSDVAQLCERLAELIAGAHQAGFEHLDMHSANILMQALGPRRYRAVFVDLHSSRLGVPISDRAVVRNLAQLNQWFRRHSSVGDRLRFLRAYLRWRNEFEVALPHGRPLGLDFPQLVRALKTAAGRHARRLWAQRDRRAGRDGRYFSRLRLPGGWRGFAVMSCKHATEESRASRLAFERGWWQEQLERPLRWFDQDASQSCKDSHSGTVRRTVFAHPHGNIPAIIKRPRARNWRRRLAQLLPPSRCRRGWRMGNALLHRDVATARPLAVLECRLGPLVLDSLLITEAVPGAVDLESFLRREHGRLAATEWFWLKRLVCEQLARQLRRLHERGFAHRDCKASNILVIQHPALKLLWIDMDGLRRVGLASRRQQRKALMRLGVSLSELPGITRCDRLRLLRSYCTRYGARRDAWRSWWPSLEAARARKRRAREARRMWKLKHYGRQ